VDAGAALWTNRDETPEAVRAGLGRLILEAMPVKKATKKRPGAPPAKPGKNPAPARKFASAKRAADPAAKSASRKGDLAPERIAAILKALDEAYPNADCALTHRTPWELLVATILSAQCTDVRVNMVTPELFRRFPTPQAMATAELPELENIIRTTGFFRNKAKSIKGAARAIAERFGGKVPQTLEELITVPGAARKTANVVLGVSFGKAEGVVVDTHVFRISRRLDLTHSETPEKVEQDLMRVLPPGRWISYSHQIIHHGRKVCVARGPRCKECNLETLCHSSDKTWWS
jgi:endonuclease-3